MGNRFFYEVWDPLEADDGLTGCISEYIFCVPFFNTILDFTCTFSLHLILYSLQKLTSSIFNKQQQQLLLLLLTQTFYSFLSVTPLFKMLLRCSYVS